MNLSRELKERLESDSALLQKAAVHLLIEVSKTYKLTVSQIAFDLGITSEQVTSWFTEALPTVFECGMIFKFVDSQLFPIEWEIRGAILGDYNDEIRVPKARRFIEKANIRLTEEGSDGEKGSRELYLLVPNGTSTVYEIGSHPGTYRIFLGIRQREEDLFIQVGRIELERDLSVGGDFQIHLPKVPEALNINTMITYIPHADHTFTIGDWDEMNRWLAEGKIIDPNFYLDCFMRSFERDFKFVKRSEAQTS